MKIVNPAWRKAVRVKLADRDMTKNELVEQAKLKSREYTSAVVNGRVQSEKYAASISNLPMSQSILNYMAECTDRETIRSTRTSG